MIHKEGIRIILIAFIVLTGLNVLVYHYSDIFFVNYPLTLASAVFFGLIIWFFRNPVRTAIENENIILAPADGKIVVIEKMIDNEYFKDERIQVSIFMSPLNVHVNRYPISGVVKYVKYCAGKYLVAWHPKSSEKNERTAVVIEKDKNRSVLMKQIAGAVARRIVTYSKEGDLATQGSDMGFIKFGSRVDLLLPKDSKILVKIGDKSIGNVTEIASFN